MSPEATPRASAVSPFALGASLASLSLSGQGPAPSTSNRQGVVADDGENVQVSCDQATGVTHYLVTDPSGVQSNFEKGPARHLTNHNMLADGITAGTKFMGVPGAEPGSKETLDSRYQTRSNPRRFFQVGRVFLTLHSESAGRFTGASTDITYDSRFGEAFHIKTRRFVVIREGESACSAIAIWTYDHRGVAKQGVKKSDHAIIYTGRVAPGVTHAELAGRNEAPMRPDAIRVDSNDRTQRLDPMSRLNFAKVYTVEHNVKVFDFGFVNDQSLRALMFQFRHVWLEQTTQRTIPQSHPIGQSPPQSRPRVDSARSPPGSSGVSQARPGAETARAEEEGDGDEEANTPVAKMHELIGAYQQRSRRSRQEAIDATRVSVRNAMQNGHSWAQAVDAVHGAVFERRAAENDDSDEEEDGFEDEGRY
ncbi:hypothetical protein LTR85_002336 [Meristemomyces frigidus]|nr:hypothetical protein LTR85_002336 [Meristemomyces frigidus]